MAAARTALGRLKDSIEMVPARLLFDTVRSPDVMRGETVEQMWKRTQRELKKPFIQSVGTKGVLEPVTVNNNWLVDGHHRLLAAMLTDPDMLIPVQRDTGFIPARYKKKPKTPMEELFADYLASSRFEGAQDRAGIEALLDRYGYEGLLRSAQDNDISWLDFRDVYGKGVR